MNKTLRVVLTICVLSLVMVAPAFAQTAAVDYKASASAWAIFLAAGLAIGVAAAGCGLGMGRAIASALEGVSRNPGVAPRIMTMMILGLALIESLAIYSLVISIMLLVVV